MGQSRSAVRMGSFWAMVVAAVLPWGATSRASAQSYLLIPSAVTPNYGSLSGSAGTYTGTPGVMLFRGTDGALVDPQFISATTSAYPIAMMNPFKAIQVGNEIWVSDNGSTSPSIPPSIYCFTADYDPVLRPHPTYIRTITGGLSLIRGMEVLGTGSLARVYVGHQGTTNGGPGPALIVYRSDGSYDSTIPMPWTSTVGPTDCAKLTVNGIDKLLVTGGLATDNVYALNADGTLDTSDFPNGIFHTGGGDGLHQPTGICVAPSGPGGAAEVWINGTSSAGTGNAIGTYRYDASGTLVAYYPIDYPLGSPRGIRWINAHAVVYTDPASSSFTGNGNVKKFDPTTPPVNEIQMISITGSPSSGSFTLTFNGQTTPAILPTDISNTVKNDLVALDNIGNLLPTLPPNPPQPSGYAWAVRLRVRCGRPMFRSPVLPWPPGCRSRSAKRWPPVPSRSSRSPAARWTTGQP